MCSCVFLQRHKRVYSCPHTHTTDAAFKSLPVKCILRGSNPRGLSPLGLKSSALTTRPRMQAPAPNWLPCASKPRVAGVMVSIVAFQAVDPGSIPGLRRLYPFDLRGAWNRALWRKRRQHAHTAHTHTHTMNLSFCLLSPFPLCDNTYSTFAQVD